jgi:adenosylcobinamide-GDP ribazoletransferase
MLKKQYHLFLTALMFYTHVPVPKDTVYSPELLNKSTRYFTLIGWIVGGFGALVFVAAQNILPHSLAILASMVATILLTGCFHEDGFADCCDAFGGGWDKEKILEIMKDSRIGTYGTVGLFMILATKFLALQAIPAHSLPVIIIVAHAISRLGAVNMIYFSTYTRDNNSKSKPIGQRILFKDYAIATIIGLASFLLLPGYIFLIYIPIAIIIILFLKYYFEKWIGGFTGDCLGATQQICEIAFYIVVIITYKLF